MNFLQKFLQSLIFCFLPFMVFSQSWETKTLRTTFSKDINFNNVLGEYPRPQMVRNEWMNLNGEWQFQPGISENDSIPARALSGKIIVPFPVESSLSGINKYRSRMWYKRIFTIPESWKDKTILLNFGAVDWKTEVFINGVSIGSHTGGYDPFSFDITSKVKVGIPQEIMVRVFDPSNNGTQPIGKQWLNANGGALYSTSSGIWQTVWMEPVANNNISNLKITPNIDRSQVIVKVNTTSKDKDLRVKIIVKDGMKEVAQVIGALNTDLFIKINDPKLWSPNSPFLYDLNIKLIKKNSILDNVTSYFGMRKISIGMASGYKRILLNNKFTFQFGPLDQGYWPDGIYTAPTDSALKWDIVKMKEMGFNMVRKHAKVEPARWYYWCDKLGLVVWQDIVHNYYNKTADDQANFEDEMKRLIQTHYNSPSIIMWTVFNEGWGQYDTERVVKLAMATDTTRLVNCASGGKDAEVGHILDSHSYPNPSCLKSDTRAVVNGEFGGIALVRASHLWIPNLFYYKLVDTSDELEKYFSGFCDQIIGHIKNGLSAAVYTQLTDIEGEINGFFTYDRKVNKMSIPFVNTQVKRVISSSEDNEKP